MVINQYHTLLPLTDEAITFHLTGSGSPHAGVLWWVSMNHRHTVSLRGDSEILRTGTHRKHNHDMCADR